MAAGLTLPNLFLVGAMKGGTTSAHGMLASHPGVYSPHVKEPNHFSTDIHRHPHRLMGRTVHAFANIYMIKNRRDYLKLYERAPDESQYAIDSSTAYLYSTDASRNIADFNPDAKIIILLRDPVDRAWSEYRMNRSIGVETADFAQACEREREAFEAGRSFMWKRYIQAGLYGDQVERYLAAFSRDKVYVDIVDRPGRTLDAVVDDAAAYLGLDPDLITSRQRENEAKSSRFPLLNSLLYYSGVKALISRIAPASVKSSAKEYFYAPEQSAPAPIDRASLLPIFKESTDKLARLTGLDVDHWRRA